VRRRFHANHAIPVLLFLTFQTSSTTIAVTAAAIRIISVGDNGECVSQSLEFLRKPVGTLNRLSGNAASEISSTIRCIVTVRPVVYRSFRVNLTAHPVGTGPLWLNLATSGYITRPVPNT